MGKASFLKGSSLFAVARSKARLLGVDAGSMKMSDLIATIQEQEGHTVCFRSKKSCPESSCCWQLSCGAVMQVER